MLPGSVTWAVVITTIVSRSALSTIVALLLWGVLPNLVGFQTTTVMSGSMEPRLMVGDAIVVRHVDAGQVAPGQVLLFDDPDQPGRLRMHRLISVKSDGQLVTKGDANAAPDTSTVGADAVRGAAFLRIPYAGLPNYWIRTGQPLPLAGGVVLVLLLMSGVRLGRMLEDEDQRERRRHRGVRLPGLHRAAAGGAVLVVLSGVLVAPTASAAQAGYTATTPSGSNSWSTGCADRIPTSLGSSPLLYWGYGTGSGQDVSDISGQNDTGTSPATSDATPATCTSGFTPAIQVGGTGKGLVVEKTSHSFPASMTVATWFKTSSAGGVLADFGGSNLVTVPSSSSQIDRALYMQSDGNLTFGALTSSVLGLLGYTLYCTTNKPGGYADGSWHLAAATFSYAGGCALTIDGGAAVSTPAPTISLQLNGYSGYWRFGYDAVTPSAWTGATTRQNFQGYLDESQVYGAVVDAAAILARGH